MVMKGDLGLNARRDGYCESVVFTLFVAETWTLCNEYLKQSKTCLEE